MKRVFILTIMALVISGCSSNPNKEERIQKLELEIEQTLDQIKNLKIRVQALENENLVLKSSIQKLESQ